MGSKLLLTIRMGVKSLLLHKLRSGLTVLGILIGVMAVIWLVAMGEGVSYQAQQQIKELGATNIIIRNVKPPQESSRANFGAQYARYGLLREDYDRIVETIPTITRAVPMREIRREARFGERTAEIKLVGCTAAYLDINHLAVAQGRYLSDRDLDRVDNVAVIGDDVAKQLFPYQDPIGRAIQIDADFYVVVGRTSGRTASAAIGGSLEARDYNTDVYIPLTTLRARIGDTVQTSRSNVLEGEIVELSQITVTVGDLTQVDDASESISALLAKFHKDVPDYAVVVPKELLRQARVLQMMFNVLLVLIAGISLLVGGIGIMNIMLATVTERTKEIGVRRALGAKRRDITRQFLTETVVLSGTGGLLGVFLGLLCEPAVDFTRWVANSRLPGLMASLPSNIQTLNPRIAPWSIGVAFVISVVVGVIFGLYPARRAAMMDPIEALRHE